MNYLFGDSGHGKVIFDICLATGFQIDAFIDRSPKHPTYLGVPCLQELDVNIKATDQLLFSIGDNLIRKKLSEKYTTQYFSVIHPTTVVGSSVQMGSGTAVMANAAIHVEASIGNHCIINTGAIVEHDCIVGDFAHISPHATLCGNVTIGMGTHVGAGAVVIPGIRIGKGCVIGAGTVVIKDIPDHSVVVGNPGRIIRTQTAYF
jgi:acetyltransferase EpsM